MTVVVVRRSTLKFPTLLWYGERDPTSRQPPGKWEINTHLHLGVSSSLETCTPKCREAARLPRWCPLPRSSSLLAGSDRPYTFRSTTTTIARSHPRMPMACLIRLCGARENRGAENKGIASTHVVGHSKVRCEWGKGANHKFPCFFFLAVLLD